MGLNNLIWMVGILGGLAYLVLSIDAMFMLKRVREENDRLRDILEQTRRDAEIVGNALKMAIRENQS